MNLEETLLYWAERGIYIDWLADCFTMKMNAQEPNSQKVCWRPVVNWYQDGEWHNDDCGCHTDISLMLEAVGHMVEHLYTTVYNNTPLSL